jgi:hypothetical protein
VKRSWQGEHHEVETALRRHRPEPRPAFIAALTEDLHERMRRPRTVRRAALVTALTVGMLTVFATFGGLGYASSAASSAFDVSELGQLVGISEDVAVGEGPVDSDPVEAEQNATTTENPVFGDQYRPGKGCGDKNHIHLRENECKKPPK